MYVYLINISTIDFEMYRVRFKNNRYTIMKSPQGFRQHYRIGVTKNIVTIIILTMYRIIKLHGSHQQTKQECLRQMGKWQMKQKKYETK